MKYGPRLYTNPTVCTAVWRDMTSEKIVGTLEKDDVFTIVSGPFYPNDDQRRKFAYMGVVMSDGSTGYVAWEHMARISRRIV